MEEVLSLDAMGREAGWSLRRVMGRKCCQRICIPNEATSIRANLKDDGLSTDALIFT